MESDITTMDLFWFFFSTTSLGLLGILAWLARRIFQKMDSIEKKLETVMVTQAESKQELRDHINNIAIHCNYPVCGRRAADAQF